MFFSLTLTDVNNCLTEDGNEDGGVKERSDNHETKRM
jgi:hypothetical protein